MLKRLERLAKRIIGEQNDHAAAVEEAEEAEAKAEAKEEGVEATPEQVAAMLQLIQTYGLDRKLANKALAKAFATIKASK
jgi:predicted  nucleic acid-binding Zn-ribbon protein